jgi:DNA polymerase III gamma/tau subunit
MFHISERPKVFEEFVGNSSTIKSLKGLLDRPDHPHCFLFYGKSGSGKTSFSRVCADYIGANELDIHEYNIGNTKGIDTARDIIDKMTMAPFGKVVVFILDEIHKATGNFQEALLKPTEDVPAHVYFFLCTTEPNKITSTLKRRFTTFEVESIDNTELFIYIAKIAKKHSITISRKVLQTLVDQSENSIGKALVLLEKISQVEEEEQLELLGMHESVEKNVRDLCQAFLQGKPWKSVIPIVKELDDFESSRYAVLAYMAAVLMNPNSQHMHLQVSRVIDIFSSIFYTKAEFILACYACSRSER